MHNCNNYFHKHDNSMRNEQMNEQRTLYIIISIIKSFISAHNSRGEMPSLCGCVRVVVATCLIVILVLFSLQPRS